MQYHNRLITLILSMSFLLLTACGGGGGGDGEVIPPAPTPPANTAPTANAGSDQTVDEQTAVTLSGSGTDSDGTISSYSWSQTDGTSVTINNADTESATFDGPVTTTQLTLAFQLTVTDDGGASASASVNVMVNPVNVAPTANAGGDQTVSGGSSVSLTGTATDNDGSIEMVLWTQISGDTLTITNADTNNASITLPTVTDLSSVVFTTTTNQTVDNLTDAGKFSLDLSSFDDSDWILVEVTGGNDIDAC